MMKFILDTNICIYIIKKRPSEVFERFEKLEPGNIGISTITLAELQYGVMKSSFPDKNRKALDKFVIPLEIVEFDYAAAIEYGKIRTELEGQGMPIGPMDSLIAAHAKNLEVTLVTNNEREFKRVKGLKVENWVL